MNPQQQKQSIALSSLQDISDYATYIDQRINRLNLLYQKLSIDTSEKFETKKYKMANSQATNPRMYETVKERFRSPRRETRSIIEQIYKAEYVSKRNRYAEPMNISNSIELKTSIFSNGRSYQSSKKSNDSAHKMLSKNKNNKLRDYQKIKNELLSSFYVGKKQTNESRLEWKDRFRNSQCKESDIKLRRGRIWHGRPPVKIIQKFE